VKLSRQGAPVIRELDTKRLLDEGSWHYLQGRPMQSHAAVAPRVNRSRGRRWAPKRSR
jgi:hypothetical protein